MAVILLILKIIGIILLILLGLILLALALVLFVPVRYRVSGDIEQQVSVRIAITWLLHLVRFDALYDDGKFDSRFRLLGISRMRRNAVENLDEEGNEEDASLWNEDHADEEDTWAGNDKLVNEEDVQVKNEKPDGKEDVQVKNESLTNEDDVATENRESTDGVERKASPMNFLSRVRSFFSGIGTRFTQFKRSIYTLKRKLADIKNILTDENNKTAILCILAELKYLLCQFKFRKLETNLTFSLGDPALTGQVLGGLCMLPFLYQYQVQVYPDFESEEGYVKGTFEIRGRVQGIHVLISAVRLLKKKEFRILLKKLLDK